MLSKVSNHFILVTKGTDIGQVNKILVVDYLLAYCTLSIAEYSASGIKYLQSVGLSVVDSGRKIVALHILFDAPSSEDCSFLFT
jgi:hypothetical protein